MDNERMKTDIRYAMEVLDAMQQRRFNYETFERIHRFYFPDSTKREIVGAYWRQLGIAEEVEELRREKNISPEKLNRPIGAAV